MYLDGKMCAAFIDLENAYDRVWQEELSMADYGKVWGVRQTSKVKAVKALYENSEARVRVEGELTDCDRE